MSGYVQSLSRRIADQRAKSQIARKRIATLLDENSFVETGAFVTQRPTVFLPNEPDTPADGVICGHGHIDGRLVFIYCQDNEVLGGSIGEMHARKIEMVYEEAIKMGAPVIGIIDSKGVRLSENIDALDSMGKVFSAMSRASGVVPQISVILGGCMGGMSFAAALSDFVFMTEKDALLFMSSPSAIIGTDGRTTSYGKLGGAKAHAENSGLVHFTAPDDNGVFVALKDLIGYLPSNNMDDSVVMLTDELTNGSHTNLDSMCESGVIDAKEVITTISDNRKFLEVSAEYATAIITGFSRFNGLPAGIVMGNGKPLCIKSMAKASSFVSFCDSFNIPIVSFTNVTGFTPAVSEEHNGIILNGARLIHAFCSATVPKINITIGDAYGSAYIIMNSKHIGADLTYAWPNAKISIMEVNAAVNVMLADEIKSADNSLEFRDAKVKEYEETQSGPYTAASRGYLDAVITPSETRNIISASLETLYSKRVLSPSRKHGSFS